MFSGQSEIQGWKLMFIFKLDEYDGIFHGQVKKVKTFRQLLIFLNEK